MQNVCLKSSKYALSALYTPPYALHRPLLPICAPRAGIPSKTDHRVRKLTYTLQPGGGRPYNRQRKGEEETHILMICKPGEYSGWEQASESKEGVPSRYSCFPTNQPHLHVEPSQAGMKNSISPLIEIYIRIWDENWVPSSIQIERENIINSIIWVQSKVSSQCVDSFSMMYSFNGLNF